MDSDGELRHMLALFLHTFMFFLSSWILMTLSDLESDYINSRECCDKLNFWTIPRLFGLLFLCVLPCSGPSWIPPFLALPFMFWYFRRFWKIPQGNSGLYEPTEIRLRHLLRHSIRETIVYQVFHSVAFFGLLFSLVSRLAYGQGEGVELPW